MLTRDKQRKEDTNSLIFFQCYSVLEVTKIIKPDSYMKIKKTCQKTFRKKDTNMQDLEMQTQKKKIKKKENLQSKNSLTYGYKLVRELKAITANKCASVSPLIL